MTENGLSGQTVVQLHLHASSGHPIKLIAGLQDAVYNVRITAIQEEKNYPVTEKNEVQLTILRGSECIKVCAEDHNQVYQETDFFLYSTSTMDLSSILFKIDVYNDTTSNCTSGIIGQGYVTSSQMSGSSGSLMVVLLNNSLQYTGTITMEYLLIHPWNHPLNCPAHQQTRRMRGIAGMKQDGQSYLCGHRGAGESFNSSIFGLAVYMSTEHSESDMYCTMKAIKSLWLRPSMYPENTISAFKAGNRMGLDFLEMDVQVSKYKVPIVFHDGTVKLCLQQNELTNSPGKKREREEMTPSESQVSPTSLASTSIEIPVKDLTVDQMQTVKVSGIQESVAYKNAKNKIHENFSGGSGSTSSPSSVEKSLHDIEVDYKLFPTLKEVFDEVPDETGLFLEFKYPLEEMDGESIDDQCMDQNEFVDCILQVVFDNARDRKVILASFDANICSMCQIKQSQFPVFFITQDDTTLWVPYKDIRTRHIDIAIALAKAQNFDGLHTFSGELLNSPERIEKVLGADVVLSVWGGINDEPEKRIWLQDRGVHCIQVDNIFGVARKDEAS